MAKKIRRSFTDEQKLEFVAKISADIAGGMLIKNAARKAGIHEHQYRAWKEGKTMKRAAPAKNGGTTTTFDVASLPKKPKKKKTHNKPHMGTVRRARIMAKIEAKMKGGMNAKDASLACGIHQSSYYLWKKKPSLLAPAVYVNGQVNGHGKANGHAKLNGASSMKLVLQVSGITLQVSGPPISVSLEDAVRLQQGLDSLLHKSV